ncbi:hypothetical protein D3C87_1212230 [compost metagenome]
MAFKFRRRATCGKELQGRHDGRLLVCLLWDHGRGGEHRLGCVLAAPPRPYACRRRRWGSSQQSQRRDDDRMGARMVRCLRFAGKAGSSHLQLLHERRQYNFGDGNFRRPDRCDAQQPDHGLKPLAGQSRQAGGQVREGGHSTNLHSPSGDSICRASTEPDGVAPHIATGPAC